MVGKDGEEEWCQGIALSSQLWGFSIGGNARLLNAGLCYYAVCLVLFIRHTNLGHFCNLLLMFIGRKELNMILIIAKNP